MIKELKVKYCNDLSYAGKQAFKYIYVSFLKDITGMSDNNEMEMQLLKMMVKIFIIFLCGTLPLFIMSFVNTIGRPLLLIIPSFMFYATSIINPFIYAFNNKIYQQEFSNFQQQIICGITNSNEIRDGKQSGYSESMQTKTTGVSQITFKDKHIEQ